jgi:7-carboxy-7-deazaguanine synthase
MKVNEIFLSIQGESSYAGRPCGFVRLTGCDLRCAWCDTAYAYAEGREMSVEDVLREIAKFDCPLVEITGGEPLLQEASLELMRRLCDAGKTVLLETNGARDIAPVDRRVIRIVDLKTPSSGESGRIRWENLDHLRDTDELKFVIATREDFEWSRDCVRQRRLEKKVRTILFSPVPRPAGGTAVTPSKLAEWILAEKLQVRLQLQLHKLLWPDVNRGV